ncbi:hypothetical protein BN7_4866 [Wickerhamomyces ciferrii]|uniref:Uncharacterized protein n=1 Tax=Wickerhamomyces ciferrii (strain ATCC 14091 / BCRC 22168 / CBS 111 / JCM 3599 / NBRC 0793 / NRRL Y-1031 F-60-10) TaxID=1206466 RepID=K0KV41_WICCF|nr:uncharacterized protein BN7_4866 [Wickerhamomyces ciferrii]CCH45284.1 hypothetical protein BN7_4866 [Wickerhamomyces ciferrii]
MAKHNSKRNSSESQRSSYHGEPNFGAAQDKENKLSAVEFIQESPTKASEILSRRSSILKFFGKSTSEGNSTLKSSSPKNKVDEEKKSEDLITENFDPQSPLTGKDDSLRKKNSIIDRTKKAVKGSPIYESISQLFESVRIGTTSKTSSPKVKESNVNFDEVSETSRNQGKEVEAVKGSPKLFESVRIGTTSKTSSPKVKELNVNFDEVSETSPNQVKEVDNKGVPIKKKESKRFKQLKADYEAIQVTPSSDTQTRQQKTLNFLIMNEYASRYEPDKVDNTKDQFTWLRPKSNEHINNEDELVNNNNVHKIVKNPNNLTVRTSNTQKESKEMKQAIIIFKQKIDIIDSIVKPNAENPTVTRRILKGMKIKRFSSEKQKKETLQQAAAKSMEDVVLDPKMDYINVLDCLTDLIGRYHSSGEKPE